MKCLIKESLLIKKFSPPLNKKVEIFNLPFSGILILCTYFCPMFYSFHSSHSYLFIYMSFSFSLWHSYFIIFSIFIYSDINDISQLLSIFTCTFNYLASIYYYYYLCIIIIFIILLFIQHLILTFCFIYSHLFTLLLLQSIFLALHSFSFYPIFLYHYNINCIYNYTC